MDTLFFLLFFVSFICLIFGLAKPSRFNKIFRRELNKRSILKIFGSSFIIFFIAFVVVAPEVEKDQRSINTINSNNKVIEKNLNSPQTNNADNTEKSEEENIVDTNTEVIDANQNNNQSSPSPENQPIDIQTDNSIKEDKEPALNTTDQELYSVASVVDGDTVKINLNGTTETLRLIGMDTPETVDPRKPVQCFGIEASNKAKELLNGRKVRTEKDPTQSERDIYGRLLVYIYRDDGFFLINT